MQKLDQPEQQAKGADAQQRDPAGDMQISQADNRVLINARGESNSSHAVNALKVMFGHIELTDDKDDPIAAAEARRYQPDRDDPIAWAEAGGARQLPRFGLGPEIPQGFNERPVNPAETGIEYGIDRLKAALHLQPTLHERVSDVVETNLPNDQRKAIREERKALADWESNKHALGGKDINLLRPDTPNLDALKEKVAKLEERMSDEIKARMHPMDRLKLEREEGKGGAFTDRLAEEIRKGVVEMEKDGVIKPGLLTPGEIAEAPYRFSGSGNWAWLEGFDPTNLDMIKQGARGAKNMPKVEFR